MASQKNGGGPPSQSLPQDPEVLAASIEQTRDDLAHTLAEIADKVSPKRVTERTKQKAADTAKEKVATAKGVLAEKAAEAKDAVLDAKDAAADKVAELRSHDEPGIGRVTSLRKPVTPGQDMPGQGSPGPVLTDQPLPPATSDPYATADPGVPKEYLAAGGAGLFVVLLLALRRRRRRRQLREQLRRHKHRR